jgi:hypothetical protein
VSILVGRHKRKGDRQTSQQWRQKYLPQQQQQQQPVRQQQQQRPGGRYGGDWLSKRVTSGLHHKPLCLTPQARSTPPPVPFSTTGLLVSAHLDGQQVEMSMGWRRDLAPIISSDEQQCGTPAVLLM